MKEDRKKGVKSVALFNIMAHEGENRNTLSSNEY